MGNPFLGVFFHWLGGLASGSFYVPYSGVKKWSWETYWLVGGFFSWIICPWAVRAVHDERRVRRLAAAIRQHALVDLFLRRDVGFWRPDVWLDDALSRHVAGHGRGAGLLRGVRHAGAADLQAVHAEPAGAASEHCRKSPDPPRARSRSRAWPFVCSASPSRRWRVSPRKRRCRRNRRKKPSRNSISRRAFWSPRSPAS